MDAVFAAPMSTADQPSDDDARLLRAFVDHGDREALAELLRRHLDSCWRLALRLSGNAADAEDVLQEATLIAMRQARRWRGGSVRAWLLGIVVNAQRRLARTALRRERRERSAPAPQPPQEDELREAAVAALAELPDAYRAPVCLRYLEGLDFPAIAAALRLRERTARTRVSRGLERLRELLAPRRAGIGAEGVVALIVAAPAPPVPATLAAAVMKTAATAPLTAVGGGSLMLALMAGTALLVAGAAAWLTSHPATPIPTAATAADVPDTRPEIERTLDLRIDLSFYHRCDPLARIQNRLPPGRFLPYAWDFTEDRLPWAGATVVAHGMRVRDLLDQACGQLELSWEVDEGAVVVFKPMRPEDRAADLAALRAHVGADERRAAARRLARSRDKEALRELLLAFADPDADVRETAADAIFDAYGTPWPTRRAATVFSAFRHDAAVIVAVAGHLHEDSPSTMLYWGAVLGVPRIADVLRAATPAVYAPGRPISGADTERYSMAIAVALGETEGVQPQLDAVAAAADDGALVAVRLSCAHALARHGDPRAVPILQALWMRGGWTATEAELLRAATVEAYDAGADGAALITTLIDRLGPNGGPLAYEAAKALGAMRDPRAVAPAIALLKSPDFSSSSILYALSAMRLPSEMAALRAVAATSSQKAIESAIVRLHLGDTGAIAVLEDTAHRDPRQAERLVDDLRDEDVPEACEAACRVAELAGGEADEILASVRTPTVIAALERRLRAADPGSDRAAALRDVLWQTHDLDAVDAIGELPVVSHEHARGCPGYERMLIAEDRHQPLPKATDHAHDSITRAEAAALTDQLLSLGDRRRLARGIMAASDLHWRNPTLPREDLATRVIAFVTTDRGEGGARFFAVATLACVCEADDLAAIAAYATALRDPDEQVRVIARQALTRTRQTLTTRAHDPLRLGWPGTQAATALKAIDAALADGPADEQPPAKPKPDF